MRILQLDKNHRLIADQLTAHNFLLEEDFSSNYDQILEKAQHFEGIIIRSRIPLDKNFLEKSSHLKFIARVGAGMENIDVEVAEKLGISLINSPEGNRDAVAEQVMGMLLVLMNRIFIASTQVKNGIWKREENRGTELKGKTFGIIGYGNMGKAVAKRLSSFGVEVIFYDILPHLEDEFAQQVSLIELQHKADIVSLHLPFAEGSKYFIDEKFIQQLKKNIYLINTARGQHIKTKSLVKALQSGKILGAALDVLEYEKSSFENLEMQNADLEYLLQSDQVLITPHIAGWTHESKEKLAQVIVDKIIDKFS